MSSRNSRVVQKPCNAMATNRCGCGSERSRSGECGRCHSNSTYTSSYSSSSNCPTSSSSSCPTSSSSSSSSCSSSSSSSCSRCSSSSSSSCCKERCNPVLGKCFERLQNFRKCGEFRRLEVYDLDTCLLSYNPRLLMVPSDDFRTLDDALDHIGKYQGGYVIKLCPGTHHISRNICDAVDSLEIIGDCSPNVGVGYLQGARLPLSIQAELPCLIQANTGFPYFKLTVTEREITVIGATNPDFSSMCPGRKVGILHQDGTIVDNEVVCVKGNSITLKDDPELNPDPIIGEGFFIYPDVIIKSEQINLRIITSQSLVIQGCDIRIPYPFIAGTSGQTMDLRHNVIFNVIIYGYYDISRPNVYLGLGVCGQASQGRAIFQSFLGSEARLIGDSNPNSTWIASFFSCTNNGVKIQNGGSFNLLGSSFLNNLLGLQVTTFSSATIQGASFIGNKFAMNAFYMSNISSYAVDGGAIAGFRPIVMYNYVAFNVGFSSQVVSPNAIVDHNTNAYILDSEIIDSVYALPVGQYGKHFSLIIIFYNPLAPEYLSSIDPSRFITNDCQPSLSGQYAGIYGVQGTSSPFAIAAKCGLSSGSSNGNGSNAAQGTGTLTGVPNSRFGTPVRVPATPTQINTSPNPAIIPSFHIPSSTSTTSSTSSSSLTSSSSILSSNNLSCSGPNCSSSSSLTSAGGLGLLGRNFL